jgi:chromosomal replication initiator protein
MMYCLTAPTLARHGFVTVGRAIIRPRLTISRIQQVVAEHFEIPEFEMRSCRRFRDVARPRQIAMYLARELTPKSLPDIGRRFGNRDHTTVIHAIKRVESISQIDGDFADDLDVLRGRLAG